MDSSRTASLPTIYTARLVLRAFSEHDAGDVQRLAGDRRVADTTAAVPHPYPDGAAVAWIVTHEAAWNLGRGVTLAVTLRDTGELVGAIGLAIVPEHRSAELGYWLGFPHWRRGYATEAARALIDHGFEQLDLHRIQAHHLARNFASGRVLEKAGMQHEGLRRQAFLKWDQFEDVREMGILRPDWAAARLRSPAA
ncbi:MAG: GNAT family N-acetyltransferase [Opitutaceae bacterium]